MADTKSGSDQGDWHKPSDHAVDPATFLRAIQAGHEGASYTKARLKPDQSYSYVTRLLRPDTHRRLGGATHYTMALLDSGAMLEGGRIERSNDNVIAVMGIVSDDIGETKTYANGDVRTIRAINLPTTFEMETKPWVWQFGWRFRTPVTDLERVDRLLNTMGLHGFTDRGAAKIGQVFRLPGSKPEGKRYDARLRHWAPEVAYEIEEIEAALGVALEARRGGVGTTEALPLPDGTVVQDEVLDWLEAQGRLLGSGRNGWLDMECPWLSEHTDGLMSGTAYAPATAEDARRRFKCQHGHCEHRDINDLLDWVYDEGGPEAQSTVHVERDLTALAALMGSDGRDWGRVWQDVDPPAPAPETGSPFTVMRRFRLQLRSYDLLLAAGDIRTTRQGDVVVPTTTNAEEMLRASGLSKVFDLITRRVEWRMDERWEAPFNEMETDAMMEALGDEFVDLAGGNEKMRTRLRDVPPTSFSPAAEYLESLPPWDGETDHIAEMVSRLPVEDHGLAGLVFRKFLMQCVQAAFNFREPEKAYKEVGLVPVLLGGQGIGKTRFVRSLVPPDMGAEGLSLRFATAGYTDHRDTAVKALSCWVGELGEIGTTTRQSDINALKNFLTATRDTYRMAYARWETVAPRSTCWIATGNEHGVLHDSTGDRRFAALFMQGKREDGTKMPLIGKRFRALLWAQAYAMWQANPNAYFLTEIEQAMIGRSNESAQQHDVIADLMEREFGQGPFHPRVAGDGWKPMNLTMVMEAIYEQANATMLLSGIPKGLIAERMRQWLEGRGAQMQGRRDAGPDDDTADGRKRIKNAYLLPVGGAVPRDPEGNVIPFKKD